MADEKRYTVLGLGEQYVAKAAKKKPHPGDRPPQGRPLAEARALLAPKITGVLAAAEQMRPDTRLEEVVIELRLDEKFLAKSYSPLHLLKETGLHLRGTGTWLQEQSPKALARAKRQQLTEAIPPSKSRALFVSGPVTSLAKLQRAVVRGASKDANYDVTKIEDIRIPAPDDRLRGSVDLLGEPLGIEVVLFDWADLLLKHAVRRVQTLLEKHNVSADRVRVRSYERGPTFIGAVVPPPVLEVLGEYNFLRAARPLPRISLAKAVTRHAFPAAERPVAAPQPVARVAIFDGGYALGHPVLDSYVHGVDLTPKPPDPECVEHGTMVASAAVFGPFAADGSVPAPTCRALAYRVLPDPVEDALELFGAIDAIEKQVPKLPSDVRVVNLSFGPRGPVDELPSRFTYAIDRLAREHGVLFVTAVGNDGAVPGMERIQPPSDSVNNLAVGAYRLDGSAKPEHATYSCRGPGRSGGNIKPDVVAFGGCEKRPFLALVPESGVLGDPCGTSFAAPLVASLAARLGALVDTSSPLSQEAVRALLVHTAQPLVAYPPSHVGHGMSARTLDEVLSCSARRVSVLYQGMISPRESWKLPFLLPPDFEPGGNVTFEWTIVYSPAVEQASPDEYTLAGLDIAFRPHADVYSFSPPKGSIEKSKVLNVVTHAAECTALIRAGWKQSPLPASDTPSRRTEQELRTQDRKWETVVLGQRGKQAGGLSEPMLTAQVVGRGAWDRRDPNLQAPYGAILTVTAPKYAGDLYADVVSVFDRLRPLTLRQSATVRRVRT
jgi:hypothetical protein